MIGTLRPQAEAREVTIVGAGVSGLLAAHYLDKAGYEVTLIEEKPRAGGMIRTVRAEQGLSESAAHSVLATDTVRDLCKELGLPLHPVRPESKARYIYRAGKMRKMPLKPAELVGMLFRAYFVLADRRKDPSRLTLSEWASRFLGRPALKFLFTPFVRGIYGSDPDSISVGAAFPMLVVPHGHSLLSFMVSKLFRRKKASQGKNTAGDGTKPGKRVMSAPEGGMGALVGTLEQSLDRRLGSRFRKGEKVETLPDARNLILTVPTDRAARLLNTVDVSLSEALARVKYTPMVSVTVFVAASAFPGGRPVRGVGVLNPEGQGRECLGILFNSSSFPGRVPDETQTASYTMMMGGAAQPSLYQATDDTIRAIVTREIRTIFGLSADPLEIVIHRWERAIPQYGNDLLDVWTAARSGWCSQPGRILFGNYSAQVSLRGLIDAAAAMGAGSGT